MPPTGRVGTCILTTVLCAGPAVMFISLYNNANKCACAMLQALDEEFPERPLYPADAGLAEEGEALSTASDDLSAVGYK